MNRLRYILLRPYLPLALLMLVACVTALSIYSSNSSHNSSPADQTIEPLTARNGGIKIYSKAILVHPYRDYWKNHPPEMDEFEPMKPIPFSELKSTSGFWARFDFAIPAPGNVYYLDSKYYYRETLPAFITCYDDFTRRPELEPITPIYRATPAYKIQTKYNRCTLIVPSRLPYHQISGAELRIADSYFLGMRNQSLFYAGVFSAMVLIILYVGGLTIYSRSKIILFYFLSLVAYLAYQLAATGYLIELGLLSPSVNADLPIGASLWQIFFFLFLVNLFESVRSNQWILYSARILVGIGFAGTFAQSILHDNLVILIGEHHLYLFLMLTLGIAFFGLFFRGIQGAVAFFSFLWVVLGVIVFALTNIGIIPLTLFTKHAPLIGTTIEMVILSVFLGFRMRQMQASRFESDLSSRAGSAVQKRAQGYRRQLEEHMLAGVLNEFRSSASSIEFNARKIENRSGEVESISREPGDIQKKAAQIVHTLEEQTLPFLHNRQSKEWLKPTELTEAALWTALQRSGLSEWHFVNHAIEAADMYALVNREAFEHWIRLFLMDLVSQPQDGPLHITLESTGESSRQFALNLAGPNIATGANSHAGPGTSIPELPSDAGFQAVMEPGPGSEKAVEAANNGDKNRICVKFSFDSVKAFSAKPEGDPPGLPKQSPEQAAKDSYGKAPGQTAETITVVSRDHSLISLLRPVLSEHSIQQDHLPTTPDPYAFIYILDAAPFSESREDIQTLNQWLDLLDPQRPVIIVSDGRLKPEDLYLDPVLDRMLYRPADLELWKQSLDSVFLMARSLETEQKQFEKHSKQARSRLHRNLKSRIGRKLTELQKQTEPGYDRITEEPQSLRSTQDPESIASEGKTDPYRKTARLDAHANQARLAKGLEEANQALREILKELEK